MHILANANRGTIAVINDELHFNSGRVSAVLGFLSFFRFLLNGLLD